MLSQIRPEVLWKHGEMTRKQQKTTNEQWEKNCYMPATKPQEKLYGGKKSHGKVHITISLCVIPGPGYIMFRQFFEQLNSCLTSRIIKFLRYSFYISHPVFWANAVGKTMCHIFFCYESNMALLKSTSKLTLTSEVAKYLYLCLVNCPVAGHLYIYFLKKMFFPTPKLYFLLQHCKKIKSSSVH